MTITASHLTELSRSLTAPAPAPAPETLQARGEHETTATVTGERGASSEFSLELNEDQLQIQKWVHDFAEG